MTKQQILKVIPYMGDVTHGYFPTEDEINEETEDADIEDFACLLLYFSTDPFTRMSLANKDNEDYKSMVEYAKALVAEFPDDKDLLLLPRQNGENTNG